MFAICDRRCHTSVLFYVNAQVMLKRLLRRGNEPPVLSRGQFGAAFWWRS